MELLNPETAADIGGNHPKLVLRDLQDEIPHQQLHNVGELARRPQCMLSCGRIVLTDRRSRLHRVADQPVVDQLDLGNMVRPLERGLGRFTITEFPVVTDIVGDLVEDGRRTSLQRTSQAGHGRKALVLDCYGRGGITGSSQRIGDHERYGITYMPYLALRQCGVRRLLHRNAALAGDTPAAGNAANAVALDVLAGKHCKDPRQRKGDCRVNGPDTRMRVGGPHKHAKGHARSLDIGDIGASSSKEASILLAKDGSPNNRSTGHSSGSLTWHG